MANGDGSKTNPKLLAKMRALPKDHPHRVKARARTKAWLKKNAVKVQADEKERRRVERLKDPEKCIRRNRTKSLKKYGLTIEQWETLFDSQGRRCAICDTCDSGDGRWHTDHDAAIGPHAVRGILCVRCNIGIGQFLHDESLLFYAAAYLVEQRRRMLPETHTPYWMQPGGAYV